MRKEELDQIINQIAKKEHTTPAKVRADMEELLRIVQNNKNPSVQAKWSAIPRKGESVTLEEFMDYMMLALGKNPFS